MLSFDRTSSHNAGTAPSLPLWWPRRGGWLFSATRMTCVGMTPICISEAEALLQAFTLEHEGVETREMRG